MAPFPFILAKHAAGIRRLCTVEAENVYVRLLRGGAEEESPAPDGCRRAFGFVFEPGDHVIRRRASECSDLALQVVHSTNT